MSTDQECPPCPKRGARRIGVTPDLHTPFVDWNITLFINFGGFPMEYRLLVFTFFNQNYLEFHG